MNKLDDNGLNVDFSGYIATFSGAIIEPLNPDPEAIKIEDIAHSLSLQARFTGHTKHLYTVGQHSLLAAKYAANDYKLWALLHDGTEAYLADMARPIKHQPGFGDVYREAEDLLMKAIIDRFGLVDERPMPAEVKRVDDLLLGHEIVYLMPNIPIFEGWSRDTTIEEEYFQYWDPRAIEVEFLLTFRELGGEYVPIKRNAVLAR